MKHFISAEQLTHPQVEDFFIAADGFRRLDRESLESRKELAGRHIGRQLISLFYEPSTRTRLSFELAATKLGIGVVSTENAREFSSAAKGETIEDTIRNLAEYNTDLLVMRHHETGAAARAVAVAPDHMAIINAGDGKGEHPTQALLDAYTIRNHTGELNGVDIVLGGDLRQGRTARSLAKLLASYEGNTFTFVSAPGFEMGEDVKRYLDERGTSWRETSDVHAAVQEADVVYWTRLQRERLEQNNSDTTLQNIATFFQRVTGLDLGALSQPKAKTTAQDAHFIIDASVMQSMRPDAILMHPLPRVDEITYEVDDDPRAQYFRQAGNGLYIRMALLDYFLGQSS